MSQDRVPPFGEFHHVGIAQRVGGAQLGPVRGEQVVEGDQVFFGVLK